MVICVTPSLPVMPVIMSDAAVSAFVSDGKRTNLPPGQGNILWIENNGQNPLAVL
jgi:hypothetical protein